jgi:hypothetical protein
MAYSKKRGSGSAGRKRGARGFKKSRFATRRPATIPRIPSVLVKAHSLVTHKRVAGHGLACVVRLSDIGTCPAFIRSKLLHERVVIQSIGVQFSVKTDADAKPPAFCLSMVSRDDESSVGDVSHFLKQGSLLRHDLSKGTCSRIMGTKELGTIASAPMICSQLSILPHQAASNLGGSVNSQSASIKVLVPADQLTDGSQNYSITCYVTYNCRFSGQQDKLSASDATELAQLF